MDLKNIESYQEVTGFTLNPEEICALNASMQQRRIDENLNGLIQFFGKFFGIEQDYLIVVNINTDTAFPTKKFYCCTNVDYTLAQLPTLSRDFLDKAKGLMTQLTGDPAYIEVGTEPSIDLSEDVEAVEEKNDEEEEETTDDKQKAKKMSEDTHFREIHRVAYIVKQIDHDCSILPRGATFLDYKKNVHFDNTFMGINYKEAKSLTEFFHFRKPESAQAAAVLKSVDLTTTTDFLDSISKDDPKALWSFDIDSNGSMVGLRHQYWTGYGFFISINENEGKSVGIYGGAYFGYGVPNYDVLFMI